MPRGTPSPSTNYQVTGSTGMAHQNGKKMGSGVEYDRGGWVHDQLASSSSRISFVLLRKGLYWESGVPRRGKLLIGTPNQAANVRTIPRTMSGIISQANGKETDGRKVTSHDSKLSCPPMTRKTIMTISTAQ